MGSSLANNAVSLGALKPQDSWGKYNSTYFAIRQALLRMKTALPVQVLTCTNNGGLDPVGFVDVLPLVNQIDGEGNAIPHVTVYNVPYSRVQGGANAVIIDPEPGDIGIAVFASRDITKVKSTKAQANPGSRRSFSMADALYLGGILNGTPTQFMRFSSDGIEVVSPQKITLNAPNIEIDGDVTISQSLTVNEDVLAGPQNVSLVHHTHTVVAVGQPTSEPLP